MNLTSEQIEPRMSRAVEAGMPVTYLNTTINAREQIEKLKKEIEVNEKLSESLLGDVIKREDVPRAMAAMSQSLSNPFFSQNKHELRSRVTAKVVEEPKRRPMFLLCNILGEDNSIIPVAFDSCSSYTLLDNCVPSKLLWASPANLPEREVVREIARTRKTKNWTVLMPLQNDEYQIVTAQTVDDLLYIPQLCTNMGMDFLRSE